MNHKFRALVIRRSDDRASFTRAIEDRDVSDLPAGDLLVRVQYSSLNYKDGLSCVGNPGVTRRFPHTPGIDAAGIVEQSCVSDFKAGDSVVVAGTALGMNVSGGFGQFIRIPLSWAVPLPKGMSLRESMIYGTAGFTAALAIHQIRKIIVNPVEGSLVVTGATGGVGSVSVSILSKLGYKVTAVTGKPEAKEFLNTIGACDILNREDLNNNNDQSLLKEAWAGGIDTVGGSMLAALLKSCKQFGTVAATGLVGSSTLPITLLPFVLRGVNLLGINAQGLDMKARLDLWSMLADEWKPEQLETIATECVLDQLNSEVDSILAGHMTGRVVVDMR